MEIAGIIFTGFFAGLLARVFSPGNYRGGFITTTLLGIFGALVANYMGRHLGLYGARESSGFMASTMGAIVILGVHRFFKRNS